MIYRSKRNYSTHKYMVNYKQLERKLRPKVLINSHYSKPTQGNKTTYFRINIPNQNETHIQQHSNLKLNR